MDPAGWNRAKEILSEALSLPAAEREAVVLDRCRDDENLRHEILALLAQPTLDTAFMEPPPATEELDEFRDIVAGTDVGGYIVIDRLGRGGMGQVFLARDPNLHRRVALKCLLASASGAGAERARIMTEARAAAAIKDTTFVATVHHVVEHRDRLFIVMEYVPGESLSEKMRRGRLTIEQVIAIGRQLAAALQAAHEVGVVHRDIKPGNIQIKIDGSVKVLDFGVARSATAAAAGVSSGASTGGRGRASQFRAQTGWGVVDGGTPPYMSPEQLRGEAVDERSDIFSLGVVLFEMLTGRRPFEGDDREEVLASQDKGVPWANAKRKKVPRALADTVDRALATNIRARWQTAGELRAELDGLPDSGVERFVPSLERLLSWAARLAIGAPLVVLTLALLGGFKTAVFNNNFGISGPFARFGAESLTSYVRWGVAGFASKLLVATVLLVGVIAFKVAFQGLELIGPLRRVSVRMKAPMQSVIARLGPDQAPVLAQTLAVLGVLALLGFSWQHADLINAWMVSFNSAPIAMLMPMRESAPARGFYALELDVLTVVLGFGLFKVLQLRRRQESREGRLSIAALAGVVLVAFLMNEAPFRSFNYRDFERADFAGERCYVTGTYRDEVLILCPGSEPPRSRAVNAGDPRLKRLSTPENVFRGVSQKPSHP